MHRACAPDEQRVESGGGLESSFPVREHGQSRNGIHQAALDVLPAQVTRKSRPKLQRRPVVLANEATDRLAGALARRKLLEKLPQGILGKDQAMLRRALSRRREPAGRLCSSKSQDWIALCSFPDLTSR